MTSNVVKALFAVDLVTFLLVGCDTELGVDYEALESDIAALERASRPP